MTAWEARSVLGSNDDQGLVHRVARILCNVRDFWKPDTLAQTIPVSIHGSQRVPERLNGGPGRGVKQTAPMGLNGNPEYALLTIRELAVLAKQSRATLYRRIETGDLKVVHPGGGKAVRITEAEAARYLHGHAQGGQ